MTGVALYAIDVTDQVRQRRAAQRQAAEAERRYQAARDVVVEVQEALLATSLPVLPGAAVAARYLVAAHDQAAGGDWFDAIPLADGTVAAVVGDIVGHGVAASAAMGQLRSVINAVLVQTSRLEQALTWADDLATRSSTIRAATLCVAVLDPNTGLLRYATCGHLPPLIIATNGQSRYLPLTGGGPLGTGSVPVVAEATLPRGEVLLLYTDGLVERPGQPVSAGLDRLARVAGDAVANRVMPVGAAESAATRVCSQGVELLTRTGYDDDVTALALQRRRSGPVGPLHCEERAEPPAIAVVRAAVDDWLRPLEPTSRDTQALGIAVTELVANAIEHGYRLAAPGVVRVDLELGSDGQLRLQVADDGAWREPTGPMDESGRGLWLVGALLDHLHVDHGTDPRLGARLPNGDRGTTVTVRHQLRRPALLASEPVPMPEPPTRSEYSTTLEEGPPRRLRVRGPLDAVTTPDFADRVDVAGRGGTQSVQLDLRDVEVLSSSAVRVLFDSRNRHATHDRPQTIYTVEGSAVDEVLTLVGLDHQNVERAESGDFEPPRTS